jgi:hypothetical protein
LRGIGSARSRSITATRRCPSLRLGNQRSQNAMGPIIIKGGLSDPTPSECCRASSAPLTDPSAIPTHYGAEMARHKVTVALIGDGGDERFRHDRYRATRHFFSGRRDATMKPGEDRAVAYSGAELGATAVRDPSDSRNIAGPRNFQRDCRLRRPGSLRQATYPQLLHHPKGHDRAISG